MSSYNIEHEEYDIYVGWDNPLQTFFGTVFMDVMDDDNDGLIFSCGDSPNEVPEVMDLVVKMRPYCEIPDWMVNKLVNDYTNRTEPTALQTQMVNLVKEIFG